MYKWHNSTLWNLSWDFFLSHKKLSELHVGTGWGFKHGNKSYDKILGIGITDLLMNLMSCHGFLKNKICVVILKRPKSILEYHFLNGFTPFECNTINLEKIKNEIKQRVHAEYTDNSDKVMTCTTTIPSTWNTLKNLALNIFFILPVFKDNPMMKRIR